MRSNVAIIILFALIIASCTKDNTTPTYGSSTLIGQWNWVFSCGGIAGVTYTPKSTGETIKIEFDTIDEFTDLPISPLINTEFLTVMFLVPVAPIPLLW